MTINPAPNPNDPPTSSAFARNEDPPGFEGTIDADHGVEEITKPVVIARSLDAEALSLARDVVGAAEEKGATDILLMDIRKLSIVADYFVICTADNDRQIRAIARAILDVADENYSADPLHKPSSDAETSGWLLIDFGPVVVHVFSTTMRDYYRLERLWSEAATLLRMQ